MQTVIPKTLTVFREFLTLVSVRASLAQELTRKPSQSAISLVYSKGVLLGLFLAAVVKPPLRWGLCLFVLRYLVLLVLWGNDLAAVLLIAIRLRRTFNLARSCISINFLVLQFPHLLFTLHRIFYHWWCQTGVVPMCNSVSCTLLHHLRLKTSDHILRNLCLFAWFP